MLISFSEFLSGSTAFQAYNVTIGVYDGVHIGHRKIITSMISEAAKDKVKTMVLTFDPNPKLFLKRSDKEIYNLEVNSYILTSLGIDLVVYIPFDEQLCKMDKTEFINNYIAKININKLTVGDNFRFGNKAEGSVADLQNYINNIGKKFEVVKISLHNGEEVSSSSIKMQIETYRLGKAAELLGQQVIAHIKQVIGNINCDGYFAYQVNISSPLPEGIYQARSEQQNKVLLIIKDANNGYAVFKNEPAAIGERLLVNQVIANVPTDVANMQPFLYLL